MRCSVKSLARYWKNGRNVDFNVDHQFLHTRPLALNWFTVYLHFAGLRP